MKNFTSVNAKYYQSNELIRIINHNLRSEEIDYLLDKEYIKWENKNFLFGLENNLNNIDLKDTTKTRFKIYGVFSHSLLISHAVPDGPVILIITLLLIEKSEAEYTHQISC